MLSGNGRHRRPRQAPALVVAAGVTGSAIAIPLLGASSAGAADGTTWDRVAECETGGTWSENSGNGYYGGLQLTQEHWEKYGGLAYASSADQASRSQQIRVAEKVLAAQGIAAWPTCGLLAGLNGGSGTGAADGAASATPDAASGSDGTKATDPADSTNPTNPTNSTDSTDSTGPADATGAAEFPASPESQPSSRPSDSTVAPDPSTSSDSSVRSGISGSSSSAAPSGTSDASSAAGDESGKPDTSGDAASGSEAGSGSGRSSGSPGTPTVPGDGGPVNSGREDAVSGLTDTGTSGSGRHRGPSADEEPADRRTGASAGRHASRGEEGARDAVDGSYTVRRGDSLWAIADSLDISGGWQALYAGNKETVGADPDHILPGQKLAVGLETGEK